MTGCRGRRGRTLARLLCAVLLSAASLNAQSVISGNFASGTIRDGFSPSFRSPYGVVPALTKTGPSEGWVDLTPENAVSTSPLTWSKVGDTTLEITAPRAGWTKGDATSTPFRMGLNHGAPINFDGVPTKERYYVIIYVGGWNGDIPALGRLEFSGQAASGLFEKTVYYTPSNGPSASTLREITSENDNDPTSEGTYAVFGWENGEPQLTGDSFIVTLKGHYDAVFIGGFQIVYGTNPPGR